MRWNHCLVPTRHKEPPGRLPHDPLGQGTPGRPCSGLCLVPTSWEHSALSEEMEMILDVSRCYTKEGQPWEESRTHPVPPSRTQAVIPSDLSPKKFPCCVDLTSIIHFFTPSLIHSLIHSLLPHSAGDLWSLPCAEHTDSIHEHDPKGSPHEASSFAESAPSCALPPLTRLKSAV